MLDNSIVFVLGAGASYPYKFPLGSTLTAEICDEGTVSELVSATLASDNISKAEVKHFVSSFRNSGRASIDAFLEARPEFDSLGRLAIATKLCKLEIPGLPFDPKLPENWYRALWGEMCSACGGVAANAASRVSFVTFNYDRSLEHFLFTAAKNTFPNMDNARAYTFLQSIHIIHLYGALGDFHYLSKPGARLYNKSDDPQDLNVAANGIHLIPQGRGDSEAFRHSWDLFLHTDTICFLGFGFDRTNVERLKLDTALEWRTQKNRAMPRIVMSTKGKSNTQVRAILEQLSPKGSFECYDKTNLETINEAGLIR